MKQMNGGGGMPSGNMGLGDFGDIFGAAGANLGGAPAGNTNSSSAGSGSGSANFGGLGAGIAGGVDANNPFLLACNQMFQDFEKISKEG